MLRRFNRRHSGQNLEPEGLARKIFLNKELAVYFGPLLGANFGKGFAFLWLCSDGRALRRQNIAE
jgi:hypothetical protein